MDMVAILHTTVMDCKGWSIFLTISSNSILTHGKIHLHALLQNTYYLNGLIPGKKIDKKSDDTA